MFDTEYQRYGCDRPASEPPLPFCPMEHHIAHGEYLFPIGIHVNPICPDTIPEES